MFIYIYISFFPGILIFVSLISWNFEFMTFFFFFCPIWCVSRHLTMIWGDFLWVLMHVQNQHFKFFFWKYPTYVSALIKIWEVVICSWIQCISSCCFSFQMLFWIRKDNINNILIHITENTANDLLDKNPAQS